MILRKSSNIDTLRRDYEQAYMAIESFDDLEKHMDELDAIYSKLKEAQSKQNH